MKNINAFLFYCLCAVITYGCQSIGNNQSFLLKYKKDLVEYYQEGINAAQKEAAREEAAPEEAVERDQRICEAKAKRDQCICEAKAKRDQCICEAKANGDQCIREEKTKREQRIRKAKAKRDQRIREAEVYLPEHYTTNIPYSLSNHYDARNPKRNKYKIENTDPLNIIINKVYLADNSEGFPRGTAEIAVVVSVEDREGSKLKNVLVSYEEGIKDKVFLDLLAYHTNAYADQPIKIVVTVFEFDRQESDNYRKVLSTAAGTAAALLPAYAPAISLASQIGDFVIKQNKDDVIAKFTFQLYPWGARDERITALAGVPRISYGHYVVLNSDTHEKPINEHNTLHAGFDLSIYEIEKPVFPSVTVEKIKIGKEEKGKGKDIEYKDNEKIFWKLPTWPIKGMPGKEGTIPPYSYIVLTVSKAKVSSAGVVIQRMNEINKTIAGLAKGQQLSPQPLTILSYSYHSLGDQIQKRSPRF